MNEITQIHLGRQAFTIAVDAQKLLRDYLSAVKKHSGGSEEVVEEVEIRMAELLLARGITHDKVVLPGDVDYLKSQLGEPGDFDDDSEDTPVPDEEPGGRKLFRDTENGMVAGVAAGLANYLNIDAVIVRLIFIALVFFGGSGVLLYLILWLLVPEAKTNSERLQMRGLAVNVENIKEVLAGADVPGATRRVSRVVGRVITTVVSIVLRIIGLGFVIMGVGLIIASAVTAIYGVVSGAQVAGTTIFPVGREEVAILVCGFVILAIIAGLLVSTGVALVRQRLSIPGWVVVATIGVFIVAASVGVGLGFDAAPAIKARYENLQHSQVSAVPLPTQVHLLGDNVFYQIVQGDKPQVEIHTFGSVDTRRISISSDVNGKLTIDATKFNGRADCSLLCPLGGKEAEVIVYLPNIATVPIDAPADADVGLGDGANYDVTQTDNGTTMVATPRPPIAPVTP